MPIALGNARINAKRVIVTRTQLIEKYVISLSVLFNNLIFP